MMMNKIQTESTIQGSIKRTLEIYGWFVSKLIQTSTNGIPDLMALKNGKTVFIEVKRPGNKPTPLQQFRHEQLRKKGFDVIVATKISDIQYLCL